MPESASKSKMNALANMPSGAASAGYQGKPGKTDSAGTTGNALAEISNEGVPLYNQKDPQWKDRILEKRFTIGQFGCAVTSTAMSLSKISGSNINPEEMDQYLDDNHGYRNEMIIWQIGAQKIGASAEMLYQTGNKDKVDKSLESGRPCVISVGNSRGPKGHWVCVAGRNADGSYIIHDPEGGRVVGGAWDGKCIRVEGYTQGTELRLFS